MEWDGIQAPSCFSRWLPTVPTIWPQMWLCASVYLVCRSGCPSSRQYHLSCSSILKAHSTHSPYLLFFFEIVLITLHSLPFPLDCKISLALSLKRAFWDFDSVCIGSIDQLEEHWYVNQFNVLSSVQHPEKLEGSWCPLTAFLFAFLISTLWRILSL